MVPSDVQQFHGFFFEESFEAVNRMEAALLALADGDADGDLIHTVFRVAHSIKGGGSMLGFDELTSFTHTLESILALLRDGTLSLTQSCTDLLLDGVDVLRALLSAAQRGEPADVQRLADVQLDLERLAVGKRLRAESGAAPAMAAGTAAAPGAAAAAADPGAPSANDVLSVRVRVDLIDELLSTVSTLAGMEARLRAAAELAEDGAAGPLRAEAARLAGLASDLEHQVAAMRRLPLAFLFDRLPRLVRDAGQKAGKTLALQTSGGRLELDKTVVETLSDPLMHLVRNAVDHGIEDPAGRVAAGKPENGSVRVEARIESGCLVVEVADDGAGLDRRSIVQRAQQMGLLGAGACPDDATLHDLLFVPGLSTVESATVLSGRGVGMDVVRRNVTALGGSVTVCSAVDRGTRFTVTVPLDRAG